MQQTKDRAADILNSLQRNQQENRLHHAYIFSGAPGTGKKETIQKFAASVFAEQGGLFGGGDEKEMLDRLVRAGHPDLLWIRQEEEERQISVEKVRELHKALSYAPLEASKRFVVIEEAQNLNTQASNAILKILEEPPSHTCFFLICSDADTLLPTIRSRCQIVRFFPLAKEVLIKKVSEECKSSEKALIDKACSLADGSYEFAKNYIEDDEFCTFFEDTKTMLLETWQQCPRIPSKSLKFLESINSEERLQIFLHAVESFLRDAVLVLTGTSTHFYDDLLAQKLKLFITEARIWCTGKMSEREFAQEFISKQQCIHRMRVYNDFHVNKKAALDNLLCELQLFSIGKNRQSK